MQDIVITLPTSTWLSSQKGIGKVLVCWVLIVLDVGSQQIMDGGRMSKSEANCFDPNNTMQKNLNQMTSTPLGASVPNTMTTGSMLQQTKNSVGFCYVIPYHRKKESRHLSRSGKRLDTYSKTTDPGVRSEHCAHVCHARTTWFQFQIPYRVDQHWQKGRRIWSQVSWGTDTLGFLFRIGSNLVSTPISKLVILEYYILRLTTNSWHVIIHT